jgi:hydroxypyruvate reductase
MLPTREQLIDAFNAAVGAVEPAEAVRSHLSTDGETVFLDGTVVGRYAPENIAVIGIGKASVAMAEAVCAVTGAANAIVATTYPDVDHDARLSIVVGGHPVPTEASITAGQVLLDAVASCGSDDLVIAVVSGGGSAAAEVLVDGVSLDDLVVLNKWLLGSGLPIEDVNEVRACVSRLKAGRLAAATEATVVTLVLSDVVGAGPGFVSSGPTIASNLGSRAGAILAARPDGAHLPEAVRLAVDAWEPLSTTTGPVVVVGSPATSANAAAEYFRDIGFATSTVTTSLHGEARVEATRLLASSKPGVVYVATGETTVTVSGRGVGGRNQEAALAAIPCLADVRGIFAAMGTDGIDGPTDAAGAIVHSASQHAASEAGWDVATELTKNNANPVLGDIGALVVTGPTGTNVCDLWMWCIA